MGGSKASGAGLKAAFDPAVVGLAISSRDGGLILVSRRNMLSCKAQQLQHVGDHES